jgi:hypothetical protein
MITALTCGSYSVAHNCLAGTRGMLDFDLIFQSLPHRTK